MFQVYFEYIKNSVMKYTLSIPCFWNACVFLTQKYKILCIYAFTVKLWSILEVDFLNLQIYIQT